MCGQVLPKMRRGALASFAVVVLALALWASGVVNASGPPSPMVDYQRVVQVDGAAYTGTGYFKFAVVNAGAVGRGGGR